MTLVGVRRLSDPSLKSEIIKYVVSRQNEDGGYAFARGSLESSNQDTYYGLTILSELKADFPHIEKTLRFLDENRIDSIYSIYYVTKAKLLLDQEVSSTLKEEVNQMLGSKKYFGSSDFFSEVSSEFTTTFMALELAKLLKIDVNLEEAADWLLSFKNIDGGFGTRGYSNINSTYYVTASLCLLKDDRTKLSETLGFIRACEKPNGGFTVIPLNFNPYMEHTYYGLMALCLLGEKSLYPLQTADWVLRCQNNSGGFARSDLGISTFVDTYYAIRVLQELEQP